MASGQGESSPDLPYRPCIGIMLINRDGHIFVGHRSKTEESAGWQMPQGGIDKGEEPVDAAWRELLEEVGTDKAKIIGETLEWLTYDLPAHLVSRVWKGRYRGQKQKWFAMSFLGDDADIDLDHHTHPEFNNFKWVEISDLPKLIVEFKRPVYERLVAEFARFTKLRR
jgi:putative (di)nucleoside polyphosphate hydrolase